MIIGDPFNTASTSFSAIFSHIIPIWSCICAIPLISTYFAHSLIKADAILAFYMNVLYSDLDQLK